MTAFEKNGLKLDFAFERIDPTNLSITMSASNSKPSPLTDFVFQAAVPKVCHADVSQVEVEVERSCHWLVFSFQSFQLQMLSPSGNFLAPNSSGSVTQQIKVTNPQKVRLSCMQALLIQNARLKYDCTVAFLTASTTHAFANAVHARR